MAVALVEVTEASNTVWGHQRKTVYDLTFSGNYATNGETVNASSVGLNKFHEVYSVGNVSAASTPTTAVPLGYIIASSGASVAIRAYELGGTGAAGDPLREKDNAEAYIAGQTVRVAFVGY